MSTCSSLRFAGALLFLATIVLAGCSASDGGGGGDHNGSPGLDNNPLRGDDVGVDAATGEHDATADAADASADDVDVPDEEELPFEPFDPVPFTTPLDVQSVVRLTWEGESRQGTLFFLAGHAALIFEHNGQLLTFRGVGEFDMDGTVSLELGAMLCLQDDTDCAPNNTALTEHLVFDVLGLHDGEHVRFAPWEVRQDVVDAFPDGDFRAPVHARLTPSNGFKPSESPVLSGEFVGGITYIRPGSVFTGSQHCELRLSGAFLSDAVNNGRVIALQCGDEVFIADENPGPISSSFRGNANYALLFDFLDGDTVLTFVLSAQARELNGVITEQSPDIREVADVPTHQWYGAVTLVRQL